MNLPEVQTVKFHGRDLLTVQVNDEPFVPLKPIVEAMGLDWRSQRAKLRRDTRWGDITTPLQTVGGVQEMLCLPLLQFPGWLFGINANRVRVDIRDNVRLFQDECFQVLHAYWFNGGAINPRATSRQIEQLTEQLCIMQGQIAQLTERNKHLGNVAAVFAPSVKYGTPSRRTGNPRLLPIRGHFRSTGRDRVTLSTRQLQLLLNLES